jgi:ribosomal protein S18 acetylase RimI-like enzyme
MEQFQEQSEKEVTIEPATPKDVKGMQEVFYKTWLATYPNEEVGVTIDDIEDRYKDAFTEEVLSKRAEQIAHLRPGHALFFAKDGDTVVGLCRVVRSETENRLQAIYVLPEYQGRGIGTLLWNEAQKYLDKDKDIVVAVAEYNQNAIDFYTRLGFEDTGKRWKDEKFTMKSGVQIPEMEMVKRVKGRSATGK